MVNLIMLCGKRGGILLSKDDAQIFRNSKGGGHKSDGEIDCSFWLHQSAQPFSQKMTQQLIGCLIELQKDGNY